MANQYMKRRSASLIIRKYTSKPQWDTISHPLVWLLSKNQKITSISEDVEKLKPMCINGAATVENSMAVNYMVIQTQNYHKIQQFHFWAYTQKNWKQNSNR